MTERIPADESEYGAKDCPRCGTPTEIVKVRNKTPERTCPECIWCVAISGTTRRSRSLK